jgi:hypothetical protein
VISLIEVWHRGQTIPVRLFETSDTNSPDGLTLFRVNAPRVYGFPRTTGILVGLDRWYGALEGHATNGSGVDYEPSPLPSHASPPARSDS